MLGAKQDIGKAAFQENNYLRLRELYSIYKIPSERIEKIT